MIMRTEVWGTIRSLGLSQTAHNLLDLLIDVQEPGGRIVESQTELAKSLEIHPNVCSRAMRQLTAANVVLRPSRVRYELHPLMAGYNSESDMQSAVLAALQEIEDGDLPSISAVPASRRRHLAAVS